MPKFSAYQGELPECLNPLNLRHYLLLAYWTYFRPTALKTYLYQVEPDFYRAAPGLQIFYTLRTPFYRNLYLIIPIVGLGLSSLIGLILLLIIDWQTEQSINWLGWLLGAMAGVTIGVLFFVLFLIVFGTTVSIARGLVTGSIVGLASGVPNGVLFSVVLGVSENLQTLTIASQSGTIVTLAASFGLAVGVAVGMAIGGTIGAIVALTIGSAGSLIIGIVFSLIIGTMQAITTAKAITGIAFGLTIGIAASAAGGADLNPARNIFSVITICGAVSVAFGFCFGWQVGLLTTTISILCALRIPFYGVELLWSLCSSGQSIGHPLDWDELLIFRLPGIRRRLNQQLQCSEQQGLSTLCNLACNPFQRWAAQYVLKTYLHQQPSPFRCLYTLLTHPIADAYIFAPVTQLGWERLPTIKQVLLGELNGKWVDCTVDVTGSLIERLVYHLTLSLRHSKPTPLTFFAGLLLQLLARNAPESRDEMLSLLSNNFSIYTNLVDYSEGLEIQRSFEVMHIFLACDRLSALPQTVNLASSLPRPEGSIRPQLLIALNRLQDIGLDIVTYLTSVSRVNKQAALLRANSALDNLDDYVIAEVLIPEQIILRHIIHHWHRLISEAGGDIGYVETSTPVPNPYVVGNPVFGHTFVGREDIIQRLEELWASPQPPSIILYGHRRMGKSSILHNLKAHLGGQTIVINFNMQVVGSVNNTNELLYALAIEIYDSLPLTQQSELDEPQHNHFTSHNPYQTFWRFLKQLDKIRDKHRFILAVDEFEILEELIKENTVEQRLIGFWRGLVQTYPWFIMIFAGLHTLDEMRKDYWSPLFSSIIAIPVSFLSAGAVQKLVTQPSPDFDIEYDREVVEEIYHLTNGQPYLTQLIGHALVTHFNHLVFEEGRQREKRLTLEDLETVINSSEFYRDGDAYFSGIWKQAEVSRPHRQLEVLCNLCCAKLSLSKLVEETSLSVEILQKALETLRRHDVIKQENDLYTYTVELMRYWVKRMKVTKNLNNNSNV
ncbi:MAG: AAA family ATPase [Coleofasciculus sp. S288]|nr:AAA family ATPase [Coleofasciculus sp. S288]